MRISNCIAAALAMVHKQLANLNTHRELTVPLDKLLV